MAISYQYPDVFPQVNDYSIAPVGTSTSIGAVVGASSRGPANIRVPVTGGSLSSTKGFYRQFGFPNPQVSYLHYTAAIALEAMLVCYVTRVVGTGCMHSACGFGGSSYTNTYTAGIIFPVPTETQIFSTDTLTQLLIVSANPGAWGNIVSISITNLNTSLNVFDILVYEKSGGITSLVETWRGVSLIEFNANGTPNTNNLGQNIFAESVINGNSNSIQVFVNQGATLTTLPAVVTNKYLTAGADGSAVSDENMIIGWDLYANPDEVGVNVLMNAGYVSDSDFSIQSTMDGICSSRLDCIAILDVPFDMQDMTTTTALTNWRNTTQNIDSSFSALYSGWPLVYDPINDLKDLPLPMSGFVGQVIATTDKNFYPWQPPAGLIQGLLQSSNFPVSGLSELYTIGQQSLIYPAGINYSRRFSGLGYAVWGQKTLDGTGSALNRINVRRTVNYIITTLRPYLLTTLFGLNNNITQTAIRSTLTSFMTTLMGQNAVYAFTIQCDSGNNPPAIVNQEIIVVDLSIQPQRGAEFMDFNLNITQTGVNITSATSNAAPS